MEHPNAAANARLRRSSCLLALVLVAACERGGEPTTPAPAVAPTIASPWEFAPPQPVARAQVDLDALRDDGRLTEAWDALLVDEMAEGPLAEAVRGAEELSVVWADPSLTQRLHILETQFDATELGGALATGDALGGAAFVSEALAGGTYWTTPTHNWAVGLIGDRSILTGERGLVRAGMFQAHRDTRVPPGFRASHTMQFAMSIGPAHRDFVRRIVQTPQVVEPLAALRGVEAYLDLTEGMELVVDLSLSDPEQANATRVLIALLARSARDADLPRPIAETLVQGRLETVDAESGGRVRVSWDLDADTVDEWIASLAPPSNSPDGSAESDPSNGPPPSATDGHTY